MGTLLWTGCCLRPFSAIHLLARHHRFRAIQSDLRTNAFLLHVICRRCQRTGSARCGRGTCRGYWLQDDGRRRRGFRGQSSLRKMLHRRHGRKLRGIKPRSGRQLWEKIRKPKRKSDHVGRRLRILRLKHLRLRGARWPCRWCNRTQWRWRGRQTPPIGLNAAKHAICRHGFRRRTWPVCTQWRLERDEGVAHRRLGQTRRSRAPQQTKLPSFGWVHGHRASDWRPLTQVGLQLRSACGQTIMLPHRRHRGAWPWSSWLAERRAQRRER